MPYRKFNNQGYGEKPVKEGETYDVAIEGIGTKGDGIGKIQGFVLVIPGAKKGDNVKVKVNAVRGKVAFAEVVGQADPKQEETKTEGQEAKEESEESDSEADDSDSEDSEEEQESEKEESEELGEESEASEEEQEA